MEGFEMTNDECRRTKEVGGREFVRPFFCRACSGFDFKARRRFVTRHSSFAIHSGIFPSSILVP
jgi:hypothetical protein